MIAVVGIKEAMHFVLVSHFSLFKLLQGGVVGVPIKPIITISNTILREMSGVQRCN